MVGESFVFHNSTLLFPDHCIYPCFGVNSWPLRDPTDIWANPRAAQLRHTRNTGNVFLAVYALAFWYSVSFIVIYLSWRMFSKPLELEQVVGPSNNKIRNFGEQVWSLWRDKEDPSAVSPGGPERVSEEEQTTSPTYHVRNKWPRRGIALCLTMTLIFTAVLSPLVWLFFVTYFEWKIFTLDDVGRENMRHVGQWGFLVSTMLGIITPGLVALGELLEKWWAKEGTKVQKEAQNSTQEE